MRGTVGGQYASVGSISGLHTRAPEISSKRLGWTTVQMDVSASQNPAAVNLRYGNGAPARLTMGHDPCTVGRFIDVSGKNKDSPCPRYSSAVRDITRTVDQS